MTVLPAKKLLLLFLLLITVFGLKAQDEAVCLQRTEEIFEWLKNDQTHDIRTYFTKDMLEAIPEGSLAGTWATLEQQIGPFVEAKDLNAAEYEELLVVTYRLVFGETNLSMVVSFNESEQIAGFRIVPDRRSSKPYLLTKNPVFEELEISIESEAGNLPGILTVPKGKDRFPIVVLVHGSGPQDRDVTIGPNTIFKNIAHGLAKQGVASIRYDKRTYFDKKMKADSMTVWEETINDAVAALKMAGGLKDVEGVYLIGHSLGAMLAPRIFHQIPSIDGIVMMAGNARPLPTLIYEQSRYIFAQDGISKGEEYELKNIRQQMKNANKAHKKNKQFKDSELPLFVPQPYWADLNTYDPFSAVKEIEKPVLILQGERDYQVTMTDYQIWQKKLKKSENVQFISYPGLNHLFIAGEGASYPEEYEKQGNVSEDLVSDISRWILKQY